MLLHLRDQYAIRAVVGRHRDLQGCVDFRQVVGERGVDDDASDLDHLADVLFRHASPRGSETGDLGGAPPAPEVYPTPSASLAMPTGGRVGFAGAVGSAASTPFAAPPRNRTHARRNRPGLVGKVDAS